ncbi:MAG: hypothetical protein ACM3NQ_22735 [Bacteroidales bacterium]
MSAMLGHSNLEQTSVYLNAKVDRLKVAMKKSDAARLHSVANDPATDLRPVCNEEPTTIPK